MEGGFRCCFRVKVEEKKQQFYGREWIVKAYKEVTVKNIVDTCKQTLIDHTKKVVQMHYLPKYFCQKLREILMTETKSQCIFFNYSDISLGKMEEEYVTLEKFVLGYFLKH